MDNYQFSKVYGANCLAYSPGSTFIATALKDKVQVRSTSSLNCIRTWKCVLPDGPSTSGTQDVVIDNLDWSPSGTCLLAFSDSRGLVWVFDLAQDQVVARVGGVLQAEWAEEDLLTQTEGHFQVLASDITGISWSPCGKWLALLDWTLSYTVHFYSPVGVHVGSFVRDLSSASAHDMAQSIKRTAWSPNGRHFALGDSGGLVHVVESENWKSIASLRVERTTTTHSASPINWLGFSPDGTVLFFGQETVLHVYAFLLDPASSAPDIEPTVTVSFNAPIKSVQYCPTSNRIAVVTRTKFLYLYDGLGVEGVEIPEAESFNAISVHWAPDGNSAAVCDKNAFCLVYEEAADQCAEDDRWDEL
ncbi:hypothetical protein CcaverHIS631_0302600 [Cutaneotrichosporon cavernicola]|nr:hypothetical protein CcaverHIS631_0302600 [Cutaneotrichosporon cavernicola]BEJ05737.1 hypothetical protein CcaverHIS641_0302590 [Cutaneotrichosporon cavernicola]